MSSNLFLLSPLCLTFNSQHLSGVYDTSYLSYLCSVISLLLQFSLTVFVALQQVLRSRQAGGSGAPAWMLKHAGFELYGLEKSGSQLHRGLQHEQPAAILRSNKRCEPPNYTCRSRYFVTLQPLLRMSNGHLRHHTGAPERPSRSFRFRGHTCLSPTCRPRCADVPSLQCIQMF